MNPDRDSSRVPATPQLSPCCDAQSGTTARVEEAGIAIPYKKVVMLLIRVMASKRDGTSQQKRVPSQREVEAVLEVNGMAHVILTVSSFERAKEFYGQLMPAFGLNKVFENEQFVYWVGGRTALGIQRCEERYQAEQFAQYRVGLHHLCFRARSRSDVNKAAERLKEIRAEIVRGPQEGNWVPGYYYVLFEDPDKIRLEICFVPGDGVLEQGRSFQPGNDFQVERPEQS